MALYTIQDPNEDKLHYIATATTAQMASELAKEFHEQDMAAGQEESKYIIKRRYLCYADVSATCGFCNNCVCMADEPEKQCPAKGRK